MFSQDPDQEKFNGVINTWKDNGRFKKGDNVYYIFGHCSSSHIGNHTVVPGSPTIAEDIEINSGEEFDEYMMSTREDWANARANGEKIVVVLLSCDAGAYESNCGSDGCVTPEPIAAQISKIHNVTVYAADGEVLYNGKRYYKG